MFSFCAKFLKKFLGSFFLSSHVREIYYSQIIKSLTTLPLVCYNVIKMPESNNITITFDFDTDRYLRDCRNYFNDPDCVTAVDPENYIKFIKPKQNYTYGFLLNKLKEIENGIG